jgi:para-aminobenzoate synthetase component 1
MRKCISVDVDNIDQLKVNILNWARSFNFFMLLDSNTSSVSTKLPESYSQYQMIVAAGALRSEIISENIFSTLYNFINRYNDWYFFHLSFDIKQETHGIVSKNMDRIGFPLAFVFQPLWVITIENNLLNFYYPSSFCDCEIIALIKNLIDNRTISNNKGIQKSISLNHMPKDEYLSIINQLKKHLYRGDIYEINYCIENYANNVNIDPYSVYLKLCDLSPAPFGGFYKNRDLFLLSSSPERFLKKYKNIIISQPIKGTIGRAKKNTEDEKLIQILKNNPKEISENIMITDLVRNDLSQFAQYGSVKVKELCGMYSFRHVHQLISTIECKLKDEINFIDAIRMAFPMGSMTGAPKYNAIKYIEDLELFKRGLFSGSIGYINPQNDFDLNVVIRSILYNQKNKTVSIPAGSAITVNSNAEGEFDECNLKAKSLIDTLNSR